MASQPNPNGSNETCEKTHEFKERMWNLPKLESWFNVELILYQGCYFPSLSLPGLMCMQQYFKPRSDDVLLVSFPKTGTTWLKALIFAIMNRNLYENDQDHPLLKNVSHDLIQSLELRFYLDGKPSSLLDELPSPRLLHTHAPFTLLPNTMTDSSCKFVYIARDPKDVLVSFWHFSFKTVSRWSPNNDDNANMMTLEDACDLFCQGVCPYGPYWDHVLSYWKASIEQPQRFLFLKYEDIKKEPRFYAKKIAEFLNKPFSSEEEEQGVVQRIVELCSFKTLKNVEVNKTGSTPINISYDSFYRKGEVGDWRNHLTPKMAQQIDKITQEKWHPYGLLL